MPDHVHMLGQDFWVRVDVVFTVGEVEKSISAALESRVIRFNIYPISHDQKWKVKDYLSLSQLRVRSRNGLNVIDLA